MIDLRKTNRIKTFGSSMYPFLKEGDVVYYKPVKYKDILMNDILVLQNDTSAFTHRVIYKTDSLFITKGDNNLHPDRVINRDKIVGKAYKVKRGTDTLRLEDLYLIQSTLYHKEIILLQELFTAAHIPFVVLKGLPLHLYYEGRHPSKMYADCDILVKSSQRKKVFSLLIKEGYRHIHDDLVKSISHEFPEETFVKTTSGFFISFDIHYQLFLIKHLAVAENLLPARYMEHFSKRLLQNRRSVPFGQREIPLLSSEDLILYLAFHFFRHNYRDITRLKIIDTIIRRDFNSSDSSQKWDRISKNIQFYHLAGFIYPVFYLCRKYYDSPIPNSTMTSLKQRHQFALMILNHIEKNVFAAQNRLDGGITRFIYTWCLSTEPLQKKFSVLFNKQFIFLVFWTLMQKKNVRNITGFKK